MANLMAVMDFGAEGDALGVFGHLENYLDRKDSLFIQFDECTGFYSP